MKILQKLLLLLALFMLSNISFAQDRFWIGSGANDNWNNTNNWATVSGGAGPASAPTAANNAIFDGNSFTGSINVNINVVATCNSFTWTATTGTLTGASNRIDVHNNFTMAAAAGVAGFTNDINFLGTANHTVDMGSHDPFGRDISFNGAGGTWTTSGLISANRDFRVVNGTLIANGNVTAGDDIDVTTVATFNGVNRAFDDFTVGAVADVTVTGLVITTGSIDPIVSVNGGILKGGDYQGWDMVIQGGGTAQNIRTVDMSRHINILGIGTTMTFNSGTITVQGEVYVHAQASMTLGSGAMVIGTDLDIEEATFDSNSQDITIGSNFDGSHNSTRTIILGSSTIVLQNAAGASVFGLMQGNLTFTQNSATIIFTGVGDKSVRPHDMIMTLPNIRVTGGNPGNILLVQGQFDTNNRYTLQEFDIQVAGLDIDINGNINRPVTFTKAVTLPSSTNFAITGVQGLVSANMSALGNLFKENLDLGGGVDASFTHYVRFEKNFTIDSGTLDFSNTNSQNADFQGVTTLGNGGIVNVEFDGDGVQSGVYTFSGDVNISANSTILFINGNDGLGINRFTSGTTINVGQNATVSFNNNTTGAGGPGEAENHFHNVVLGAGSTWMFHHGDANTSYVYGNFTANFDCTNPVTIRSFNTTNDALVDFRNQPVPQWPLGTSVADIDNINAVAMNTNAIDAGNNTNLNFPVPGTVSRDLYWIAKGGSDSWNNVANWSTTSGGLPDVCTPPTINDDVFFDANSFSLTSATVNLDAAALCRNMSWAGSTNTPDLLGASTIMIGGSVALSTGMTNSATGHVTFVNSTGTNVTLETFGKTFGGNVIFNATSAWVLVDGFKTRRRFILTEGTFDSNGETLDVGNDLRAGNANVRSLILDNSLVTIGGIVNSGHVEFFIQGANMTFSAIGTGSITFKNVDVNPASEIRLSLGSGNSPKSMPDLIFDDGTGANPTARLITTNLGNNNNRTNYKDITLVQTGYTYVSSHNMCITVSGTITFPDNTTAQLRTRDTANPAFTSVYGDMVIGKNANIDFGISQGGIFNFFTGTKVTVDVNSTVSFTNNEAGVSNTYQNVHLNEGVTWLFSAGVTSSIVNGAFTVVGGCTGRVKVNSDDLVTPTTVNFLNQPSYPVIWNAAQIGNIIAGDGTGIPPIPSLRSLNGIDDGGNTRVQFTSDPTPRTLFWVGAGTVATTSNWSDCNNWSLISGGLGGELAPDDTDDAIFDVNSFSVTSATVTIDATAVCHDMTWNVGVTNTPLLTGANDMNIHGSLDMQATMQAIAPNLTGIVYLQSLNTATINMPSNSFRNVTVRGSGGFKNMLSAFTVANTLALEAGTLDTQNLNLTVGNFNANNVLNRALVLGTSAMTVTEALLDLRGNDASFGLSFNPATVITFTTATNIVVETGNFAKTIPHLVFTTATNIDFNVATPDDVNLITFGNITVLQAAASTFDFNGLLPKTFGNILLADNTSGTIGGASVGLINTFSGTVTLGNSNSITVSGPGDTDFNANVSLGNLATLAFTNVGGDTNDMINLILNRASTMRFSPTAANNLTGVITVNTDCSAPAIINSSTAGVQATLTLAANQNVFNTFIRDINVAGAGTLNAPTAGANLGNNAGNITFNAVSRVLYWVGKQGVAPNSNWTEAGNWSLASGGVSGECPPTIVDDVFFDANSFSVASSTVTMNVANTYARSMDWTGATNTPALVTNTTVQTLNLGGNLKLIPAMTLGNGNIGDTGAGAPTIGSLIFASTSTDGTTDYTIDMGDVGVVPTAWLKRFRRVDFNANLVEVLPATTWTLESPFAVTRHFVGATRGGIYMVAGELITDGFDMEYRYITANTGPTGFNIAGFDQRGINMTDSQLWTRATDTGAFGGYNIDLREDGDVLTLTSNAVSRFRFDSNATYSIHVGQNTKTIPDIIFSDPATRIDVDDSGLTAGQVITFNAFDVQEAGIDIDFNGTAQKIFLEPLSFLNSTNLLMTASSDIAQRNDFQGLITLGTGTTAQFVGANEYVGLTILANNNVSFTGAGNHDFQTNLAPIIVRENSTVTFGNTQAAPNINTFDQVTMFGGVTWAFSTTANADINNIIIDPTVACTNLVTITSNNPPTRAEVDFNNALTLADVDINNINNTGALVTVNSFVFGSNNIGNFLDNTLTRTLFWVGNAGSWNDPAHWSLASGGAGGECPPRIIDDVFFDANSFSIAAQTVTVQEFPVAAAIAAEAKSINFTGTTNMPLFDNIVASTLEIGGDLTLIPPANLIWDFQEPVTFSHETGTLVAANIIMAGQNLDNHAIFDGRLDQVGDGWIFVDAFHAVGSILLDNGFLDFNAQNVTASSLDVDVNNDGTGATRSLNTNGSNIILYSSGQALDLRGNDNTFTFSSTSASVITFGGTGNIIIELGSTAKTMPQFVFDRAGAVSAPSITINTSNSVANRMAFRNITSLDNGTGSTDFSVLGSMAKFYENVTLLNGMDATFDGITTATFVQGPGNFFNIGSGLEPGFNIISGTFTIGDDTELDVRGTNDFRQAVTLGTTVNNAVGARFNQSLFRSTFNIASGSLLGNADLTFNNNTEFRDDVHIWGGGNNTTLVTFNNNVRLQGTGACNAPFPAADVLADGIAPITFHAPNIDFRTNGNTDFGGTLTFMGNGVDTNIGGFGASTVTIYRCDVDFLGTSNGTVFSASGNFQSISYFAAKLNITSTPNDNQSRATFNGRTYFRDNVTLGSKTAGEGFSNGVLPLLPPGAPPVNFRGPVDFRTALLPAAPGNQNQSIVGLGWVALAGAPLPASGVLLDIGQNARVEFTNASGTAQVSTFIDVQYDVNCITNYRTQNDRTFSNIFLTDFNIFNMPNRSVGSPLVEASGGLTRVDVGYITASVGCDAWIRLGSTLAGVQTDLYLDNPHTTAFGKQWIHVDMLDVNVDDGSVIGTPGVFGQAEAASSQNLGNNSTIPATLNFTIPAGLGAYYWVGTANNGLWSDSDNWALQSGQDGRLGGAPQDDHCVPSSSDNIFFDNNSFSLFTMHTSVIVDIFQVRGRNITWEDAGAAAVTNHPELLGSNIHVIEVYGDYNLALQTAGGAAVGTMNNAFPGTTHMRGPMVNSGLPPTRIKHVDSNGGRFFGPVLFEGSYDPITSALDSWVIDDEMNVESNLGTGDITIRLGEVNSNNQTISLEGDWTVTLPIVTGGGVNFPQPLFIPTSSTVIFDGNGANAHLAVNQAISVANVKTGVNCVECSDKVADLACSTSPFYNITVNKRPSTGAGYILNINTYSISVYNDFDLQVGEVRDNANQIRGNTVGDFTMGNNTKLRIGTAGNDATVFPTCFQTANITLATGTTSGFVTNALNPAPNINNASIVDYMSDRDQLIAGSTQIGGVAVGPSEYGTLRVRNSVKSITSGMTIAGTLLIEGSATLRDMGHQIKGNSHDAVGGRNRILMRQDATLVLGTDETAADLIYPSTNFPPNITIPLAVSSGTSTTFPLFTVGNGTLGNGLVEDRVNAGKMDLIDNTTVIYNSSNLGGQEVLGGFTYRNLTIGGLMANLASPNVLKTIVANPTSSGNLNVDLALFVQSGNHFKDDGWQITGSTGTGGFTMQTGSLLTLDDRAGVSTIFPINYLRTDITFANSSEVIYNGDFTQNISKEPVYYDITATAPITTAAFALVDKKFMPANAVGQTIAIRNEFIINPHNHVWDNGTQIHNSIGPAGSVIMISSGGEVGLSKLTIGTEFQATQFPTNFTTHVLNDFTTVSYDGNPLQRVRGLSGAGTTSYYDLILTKTNLVPFALKYLDGATTIRNDFTMNASLIDNDHQITGNTTGDMYMPNNDFLTLGGHLNVGGVGVAVAATIFPTDYPRNQIHLSQSSTINYNATIDQVVSGEPTYGTLSLSGQGFNAASPFAGVNKTFDNSPHAVTYTSATITNSFFINHGVHARDNGLQLIGNSAGSLVLQTNSQLTLGAGALATFFPTNYLSANINLSVAAASNATVSYAATRSNTTNGGGTLPNTVPEDDIAGSGGAVGPAAYRHLIIESGGVAVTKTLDAGINVRGNLNIENNNTLDVLSQFGTIGVFDINLGGDWTNNNGTFTMRTGTVILDNDEDGTQSLLTNASPFFKLEARMTAVNIQDFITMRDMLNIGDGVTTDGVHRGAAFFGRGIFRPLTVAPLGDTNVNFDNENRDDFNNNVTYQKMLFHELAVVQGTGSFPLPAPFIVNGTPNDNSFVDAPVMKIGGEDFYFPVGNLVFYAPAGLLDIAGGDANPEAFSVYYKFDNTGAHDPWLLFPDKIDPGKFKKISRQEFWMINRSDVFNGTTYDAASSAHVSLSWHTSRSGGVGGPLALQVAHWVLDNAVPSPTDLGTWGSHGNAGTANITGGFPLGFPGTFPQGTIKSSILVSDFSPFTFGTTKLNNILPIELLYFEAEAKEDFVELRWETVSEFENDFFTLEKSKDGITFEVFAEIPSKGSGEQSRKYIDYDVEPFDGLSYYRLKQTDYDGTYSYSKIISVYFSKGDNEEESFILYPNPTDGSVINLGISGIDLEGAELMITDMLGREVYRYKVENPSVSIIPLKFYDKLASGNYILKLVTRQKSYAKRFIVD